MKVIIKFKSNSIYQGKTEIFENVVEIHYNYNNTGKIAIECQDTGFTYNICDIVEFETTA